METKDGLLTYYEAAKMLGRTRQCLYHYIRTGALHPIFLPDLFYRHWLAKAEVEVLLARIGPIARH